MIKEALQYLVELKRETLVEVNAQNYSTVNLHHVKQPSPASINITSLTGLVDYIKSNDVHVGSRLLIHVVSPTQVRVYSTIKPDANRDCYISCEAQIPKIHFDTFMDSENFNIMVQSCFEDDEERNIVLKVVGNIKEENVRTTGDDGISQTVTAKVGIAKVDEVVVPNPVLLTPYRTFTEVTQPFSKFIFRMKDGPLCALFEADGGAWKNEAMLNIKGFLQKELEECPVEIIA